MGAANATTKEKIKETIDVMRLWMRKTRRTPERHLVARR